MPLLAVNHHYYRETGPGQGIYPTSPRTMVENISTLRARGWNFGAEREIQEYLAKPSNTPLCIITLDDGLKEQMRCLQHLESMGVPALFFVSTAPVLESRVLDVHKLHMIRSKLHDDVLGLRLDQKFGMFSYIFDDEVLATQYRYDAPTSRRVKYYLNFVLDSETRLEFISAIFAELFGDEKDAARALYMDEEDWKILAQKGLLGTHGHSHLPLATLDVADMRNDISLSLEYMRKVTGSSIQGISYPFGGKTAVSDNVFYAAREFGLTYGFTMQRGVNQLIGGHTDTMQLQRIDVNDLRHFINL